MQSLYIGINDELDTANDIFDKYIKLFDNKEIAIDKDIKKVGDTVFLKYELKNSNNKKYSNVDNIFKNYIANAISEIILDIYQEKLITRLINFKCNYFDYKDKERIKNSTINSLKEKECIYTDGVIYKISRKARILKAIIEYLENNNEIIIEGFINFRLKFFVDAIKEEIDRNIENIIIEKEFEEFIKILKYFVEIQESKIDMVNIVIDKEEYRIYDKNNIKINDDFVEEIADEFINDDITNDDLLISSLITLAPKKIILHIRHIDENTNEMIKIINSIFTDRVSICEGCKLCNVKLSLKNEK